MGMLRFKDTKEFNDMLRGSHLRVRSDTSRVTPAATTPAPVKQKPVARAPQPVSDGPGFGSNLEASLWDQMEAAGISMPVRQYPHLRGSRHTLDFAWPDRMIGLEVQGQVHRIKGSFKGDITKRAQGLLQGWRVLEVGGDQVRDGTAIRWLVQLLGKG